MKDKLDIPAKFIKKPGIAVQTIPGVSMKKL